MGQKCVFFGAKMCVYFQKCGFFIKKWCFFFPSKNVEKKVEIFIFFLFFSVFYLQKCPKMTNFKKYPANGGHLKWLLLSKSVKKHSIFDFLFIFVIFSQDEGDITPLFYFGDFTKNSFLPEK